MLKDFGSDTLPIDALHIYDASQVPRIAMSTWPGNNAVAADLVFEFLQGFVPTTGWMTSEKKYCIVNFAIEELDEVLLGQWLGEGARQ